MHYYPPKVSSYYFGRINREESEPILRKRGCSDGLFLLREKLEEPGSYVLSLCYQRTIKHYKFERNKDKTLQLGNSKNFIGPIELIEFLKDNDVGMVCRPSTPCTRISNTEPVYYLFVSNKSFDEAVANQIRAHCKTSELDDANGRFRYIYEKMAIKDIHLQMSDLGFFKRNTSKQNAEVLLKNPSLEDGKFLLRCNRFMRYKLSLCFNNNVYHYKIYFKDNKFSIKGSRPGEEFEFLIQLIDFYGRIQGDLKCKLTMPFSKVNFFCDTNSNYRVFLYDDEIGALAGRVRKEEVFISDLISKLPKSILILDNNVGEGFFSKVFKASYRPNGSKHMTVALKILKEKNDDLVDEANKIKILNHENIVKIVTCDEMNSNLHSNVIILEYADLGSMKDYIKNNQNIESKKLINYSQQIAMALQHMAERKCVHRDVAARNVLVFTHDLVKLSDFGLAKQLEKNNDYYKYYFGNSNSPMPIKWYPPEVLREKKFSEKSDAWSYGVFLWEIFSFGGTPYGFHTITNNHELDEFTEKISKEKLILDKPLSCPQGVYDIMKMCWIIDYNLRPTFSKILLKIEEFTSHTNSVDTHL